MQTNQDRVRARKPRTWQRLTLVAITALLLAACGGDDEPTPAPTAAPATATAAPTATTASATDTPESASVPESPLDQPTSPLSQPESPLTAASPAATPLPTHPKSLEEAIALAAETTAPEPTDGHGSIAGVVYSPGNNRAVYGTGFYLTAADEVDGEFLPPTLYFGPRPEEGDIVGETNMQAQVMLDNVPPGHYYLMMWTVYSWLSTYENRDDVRPLLINIEEGDQLDLGVLYTVWP